MIGRFFSAIGRSLQGLRYFFGDLFYLLSRPFRGLGRRLKSLWNSVSAQNKLRAAVALGALAIIAVIALLVVPNLPCGAPGGDDCAPEDEAIALVPADSLAYVHMSLEPGTDQYDAAVTLANRTPLLTQQLLGRALPLLIGASGQPPSFSDDIEPWFAGEIAVAVVPGESGTQQVQLLEVSDTEGARAYEASIAAGEPQPEDYQGTELREDDRGLATAIVDDFLVIGTGNGVRSVIDVAQGVEGADSLESEGNATDAIEALPEERLAEAYLSAEGIDSFLALSDGALAPFEPLVDSGDSARRRDERERRRERLSLRHAQPARSRAKRRRRWLLRGVHPIRARTARGACARHACLCGVRKRRRDGGHTAWSGDDPGPWHRHRHHRADRPASQVRGRRHRVRPPARAER